MTELIPIGVVTDLVGGQIYALPNKYTYMFCETAGASFEQSNLLAFTDSVAVVLANGMSELSGGFIQNMGVATVKVILKRL
jgi:hypothetical protein